MKRTLALLLAMAFLSAPAYAGEPQEGKKDKPQETKKDDQKKAETNEAIEILKKVDAAAKAVKAAKYRIDVVATGSMASRVSKARGQVILSGYVAAGGSRYAEKFYADLMVTVPGSSESKRVEIGSNGDKYFVVDHANKKAYEDIDPAVLGSFARILQTVVVIEFVHPTPFGDEINGNNQVLKGSKRVGDVDCHEIQVVYAAPQAPEAIWCFSKKDFLPRSRTDVYPAPEGERPTIVKVITHLEIDPKFAKDPFTLKLPEGFTKTDGLAP